MRAGGKTLWRVLRGNGATAFARAAGRRDLDAGPQLQRYRVGSCRAAISYALGQGATLIAAIWGVAIWKEFRGAPRRSTPLIALMFAGYALGLTLIGLATL